MPPPDAVAVVAVVEEPDDSLLLVSVPNKCKSSSPSSFSRSSSACNSLLALAVAALVVAAVVVALVLELSAALFLGELIKLAALVEEDGVVVDVVASPAPAESCRISSSSDNPDVSTASNIGGVGRYLIEMLSCCPKTPPLPLLLPLLPLDALGASSEMLN
jgi:hypothetical protein